MTQLAFDNMPTPDNRPQLLMLPNVYTSQQEMLVAIQQLYGPIHADVTYSTGAFWRGIPQPPIRTDLNSGDVRADFTNLPFASRSLPSMIIDPPFLADRGRKDTYDENSLQMQQRFTAYEDIGELMASYTSAIYEAYRVIKPGGYLAFKCQDIVYRQRYLPVSCYVWQIAQNARFVAEDKFILIANNRMTGAWKKQMHSRRFDSNVWIFIKPKGTYARQMEEVRETRYGGTHE